MTAAPPLLEASRIGKRFGTTRALREANLALHGGEVHALVGENGAGKSTLVKILVGAERPDTGTLRMHGRGLHLGGVGDAIRAGIVPVYQQLTLMPHLSILENLFAFELAAGSGLRTRPSSMTREHAREMLAPVGLDADPLRAVATLPLAERQLVEIARGLARECECLVLDEPTASLNRAETQRLFDVLRRLCAKGTAVLFISHNLDEVIEIGDRVSVLRDGNSVMQGEPVRDIDPAAIVERMVGHSLDARARFALPEPGDTVMRVRGLGGRGFSDVSFCLARGEVVGIVGLVGSGVMPLGGALGGAEAAGAGTIECDGVPVTTGDRVAMKAAGVALVPGDRETEGMFAARSVLENASASSLEQLSVRGWLRRDLEARRFLPWLDRLRVTPRAPRAQVSGLSGGNQQKVLLARALATAGMKVLVALEPTRGVDIGAREIIRQALVDAAGEGAGVVVVSSEIEEVQALCHRILVMRAGRVIGELPGTTPSTRLLAALTGAAA